MSYTVFALKWRPQDFKEIVGQDDIVARLKNSIEQGRIANAYIFAGPRGVGKTSTARILAKALNCKNGPTYNPCQKCFSCIEISQGRSFDVIEIDGASNRGIDEIRVLRENVKFAPTSGKYKIYIIDEVHMLTQEAFNALLKTLEEPPEYVKFIFATTQPHKVISTILSRCQRFDFRRIPILEIIAQLKKITQAENISVDEDVLFAVAKSSDGSLRDAESILDQLVSFSKGKVSLKDVISVLGLVEQDVLFGITDMIIRKDAKGALAFLSDIINQGKDPGVFLVNLIEHFRNLMVAKVTHSDAKIIDLPQEICQRLLQQAQALSLEEIFNAFNVLVNAQEMSKRLESMRIPLEISLVKLAHDKKGFSTVFHSDDNAAPALHKMTHAPARDNSSRHAVKDNYDVKDDKNEEPKPSVIPTGKQVSLEEIKERWTDFINSLSKIKMSLATYLNEGEPHKLEDGLLTISLPKSYSLHKESLERKDNKAVVEKIIHEAMGTYIKLNFVLSDNPAKEDESNIFLKKALHTFNGRVIKEE